MKILLANDNFNAHYYERVGLARAFSACDHQVMLWHTQQQPVNDAFDEFEPDIFIGQTYNIDNVLTQAIMERPHLKVLLKASDWGPAQAGIDLDKYPILCATETERNNILKLKEQTGQPEYLFIYYHPDYINDTHGSWMDAGIPVHSQLLAADIFAYTNGVPADGFRCDIMFLGGHWPYKAQVLDRYLTPLCHEMQYRIKIFGNSQWPVAQYCGHIPDDAVKHALSSAAICPNLSEPHAQDFGFDVNERCYKLAANKCFIISDYVDGLWRLYGDSIVYAHDPEEFWQKIEYFIDNPDDKQPYIDAAFKLTIENHTYIHRVAEIFTKLGYPYEAQKVMQLYPNILERLNITI